MSQEGSGWSASRAAKGLKTTLRDAWAFTQLRRFLIAFFVYGLGVQTMISFAAILAYDFGIRETGLFVFTLQIAITAGASAVLVSKFQDRIGVKRTIACFLSVWILSCATLLVIRLTSGTDAPQWLFWVVGNGIGIGLGGIGTSSRSMVGAFSPCTRVGEFFGLWGMTYKLAGAFGVLSFGQVKAWIGTEWALGLLVAFFAIGLILLMRVDVSSGRRIVLRHDRDHHAGRQAGRLSSTAAMRLP